MSSTKDRQVHRRRNAETVLLVLTGVTFILLMRYHWRHVCDDAFISFRYANHVVAGDGAVWNVGERVEGYSSPLWLGLMVLGRLLGVALPGWAAALGVAAAALCLLLVHRLAAALSGSRIVAASATAAAALVYPSYYWAPAGLETTMFAALATAASWSLIGRSDARWAWVAAFLGVARPEGPLLLCALVALVWFVHGRTALRPDRLALAFAPALGWLIFRRAYYGEWLPNTYYAKATGAMLERLTAGALYALPSLVAAATTVAVMWSVHMVQRCHVAVMAFAGLVLALVMGAGGDWMWHGRLVLPALPVMLTLAVVGVARAPVRRRFVWVGVCLIGWLGFAPRPAVVAGALELGHLPEIAYQEGSLLSAARAAAAFIAEHYPADALVAVNHAGILPYSLPNPVLDMAGLCDHHIGHDVEGGLHGKYDAAYVLSQRPRLIVLNTRVQPDPAGAWYHPGYWIGETVLFAQPDFQANYRPVPRFWQWHWLAGNGGFVLLYERSSNPSSSALKSR